MAYTPYMAPANRPDDLNPNRFGEVGGSVQNQEVVSAYDIYKPNELIQVFERHSFSAGFRLMLKAMGFNRGTAAPTTGHYEYPWRKDLVRVNAIITASAGAGNNMVVELESASMFSTGVTSSGTAQVGSYPVVGDIIKLPSGVKAYISAKSTATNPHRLTLTPVDSTVDLDAHVAANEEYFISDRAFAEGSGLPAGRTPRVIKYANEFQIVKAAAASTGSEMTNQTYFQPIPGQEGSFYLQTQWSTLYDFEQACDGALLWGTSIDNVLIASTDLGFDVPVKGTEGLLDFASTNGYTVNYTTGALAVQDFDSISRLYELERIGVRDIMSWQGVDYFHEIENALQTLLNADLSAQLYKKYMDDGSMQGEQPFTNEDLFINIGFTGIKKGGFSYGWKLLHAFNEAMGAGSDLYDYTHWAVYHPMGFVTNKATGALMPTVGYEYKQLGNYSRETVIAEIAGVGVAGTGTPYPIAVNVNDIHRVGYVSELSFHGTCANHMMLHTPS